MEDQYRKEVHDAAEKIVEASHNFWASLDFQSYFKQTNDCDHTEIAAFVYKYFSGRRYTEIDEFAEELKQFNQARMKEHVCDYDKEKWSYEKNLQTMKEMHEVISSHMQKSSNSSEKAPDNKDDINKSNESQSILDKLKSFLD